MNEVIRLTPGVRLHVQDDRTGFLESPDGVRRLAGAGLLLLEQQILPRLAVPTRTDDLVGGLAEVIRPAQVKKLLAMLREQGALEPATETNPTPRPDRTVAITGRAALADELAAVLARVPGIRIHPDDADLTVAATGSLFDPELALLTERSVRTGQPLLTCGVVREGVAFAGPLWTPGQTVACFECLRTRVFANSAHGTTWRAYTSFLAATGRTAVPRAVPPWTVARLSGAVARRVAAWLDGHVDGTVLWIDEDESESEREPLPVPTCPVCGAGGPADSALPLTAAVDDRVGIVHSVHVRRAESGPQIYLAGSTSSDLSLVRPNLGVVRNGGAGFHKQEAVHAAIGESLERYAAGLVAPDARTATFAQLTAEGEQAVPPEDFGLFSPEQYAEPDFPFVPFTPDTPVRWVRAVRWLDRRPFWVPASQVYLYYRRARAELPIAPSISTGLAAGPTVHDAVLGGLYEIIERDALAISWLHRLPPRPVPPEAASNRVRHHLGTASSWQVGFSDLSLDLAATVVVAVMEHRGGPDPIMSFGAACRMSPQAAVEKAFLEAAQGLTYVRRLVREYGDFAAKPGFANVDEFNKHAILYIRHPELRREAGYLVHPDIPPRCDRPLRDPIPQPADPLDTLVRELASRGLHTYVVELSTADTRRVGVQVVRVLVPGLQHLAGAHRFRLLGTPRLRSVVRELGFSSEPDNPYPHPLP